MTLFGVFHFEVELFPLGRTLLELPDTVVETERIVASEGVLSPYFWVETDDLDSFEQTAAQDPTVESLRRMDVFDDQALYKVEWTAPTEAVIYDVLASEIVVLDASANHSGWEVRIRFDDREQLSRFRSICEEIGTPFVMKQLYRETQPMTAGQYGLTDKQQEALVTAWNAGYFESSQRVTLDEIADSLGITRQSLSQRLRRAHDALIANTLIVTPPGNNNDE